MATTYSLDITHDALKEAKMTLLDAEDFVVGFQHSSLHKSTPTRRFGLPGRNCPADRAAHLRGEVDWKGDRLKEPSRSAQLSEWSNVLSGIRKKVCTATAVRIGDHFYFWKDVPREKIEAEVRKEIIFCIKQANKKLEDEIKGLLGNALTRGLDPDQLKSIVDELIVQHVMAG